MVDWIYDSVRLIERATLSQLSLCELLFLSLSYCLSLTVSHIHSFICCCCCVAEEGGNEDGGGGAPGVADEGGNESEDPRNEPLFRYLYKNVNQ